MALAAGDLAMARDPAERMRSLVDDMADPHFIRLLRMLDARIRIHGSELEGLEYVVESLLAELDENALERVELAIELGTSVWMVAPGHPVVEGLLPIARLWAGRFYPAARLSWLAARSPADCEQAELALRNLPGEGGKPA